jgi:iron(III) transport system substrate-binding protein
MTDEPKTKDRSWRDDEFARHEVFAQWWWLVIPVIGLLGVLVASTFSWFKQPATPEVIVYAAQDQVYAEPILREFEKATGIKVKAVHDSEAVKTVGLANRLLAERSHPQCDVFWGNEEMRTRQLAVSRNGGIFRETNGWAAFGYRSRRIVINTNFVQSVVSSQSSVARATDHGLLTTGKLQPPRSLLELTNAQWRGKIALAFPQFGTTATHFHALRQLWGKELWLAWCRALAANKPFIVDGNSVVVKFVARGEAWIGLTDSDDIAAGQREGQPIAALPLTDESLLIPNTVAVIRNAPHPANAQKFFDYLQRREVAEKLVQANALERATLSEGRVTRVPESTTEAEDRDSHSSSLREKTLRPDWDALLRDLETTTKQLNEIFLR